jgi:RNA polymerase sigma factor (TIGR02999 family)
MQVFNMPVLQPDTLSLLRASRSGDESVFDALFSRMYGELREIAHQHLRSFRPGETLNTTALVHEAYIKLVDQGQAQPQDRAHFLALASRAIRFILVDHARARTAAKRGGHARPVELESIQLAVDERAEDLLQLDDALQKLAQLDERLATVVEYRFFGGLAHDEIAEATGRSVPTVKRDWTRARTWLFHAMKDAVADASSPDDLS